MRNGIIVTALLLLTAGAVYAQPFYHGMVRSGGDSQFQGPPPNMGISHQMSHNEPILLGHGFAIDTTDGLEYHTLHINIIKTARVLPTDIRSLLEEGLSPWDIIERLLGSATVEEARGHVQFAGVPYGLNVTHMDNVTVEGDLLKLPDWQTMKGYNASEERPEPEVVGSISLTLEEYEGERVATGTITVDGETYDVLLSSPAPSRFGFNGPGEGPREWTRDSRMPSGMGGPPSRGLYIFILWDIRG